MSSPPTSHGAPDSTNISQPSGSPLVLPPARPSAWWPWLSLILFGWILSLIATPIFSAVHARRGRLYSQKPLKYWVPTILLYGITIPVLIIYFFVGRTNPTNEGAAAEPVVPSQSLTAQSSSPFVEVTPAAAMPAKQLTVPDSLASTGQYADDPQTALAGDGSFLAAAMKIPFTTLRPIMAPVGTSCDGSPLTDDSYDRPGTATDQSGTCYQLGAGLLATNRLKSVLVEKTSSGMWAVDLRTNGTSSILAAYTATNAPPAVVDSPYQAQLAVVQAGKVVTVLNLIKATDGAEVVFADLPGKQQAYALYTTLTGLKGPS